MNKADLITQEWEKIKRDVSSRKFISEVESIMDFNEVRIFRHGKFEYNEFDIPQHMISVTTDDRFIKAEVFVFKGIFQWKNKENSMVSKKIILFNDIQNLAYEWDLFKDE